MRADAPHRRCRVVAQYATGDEHRRHLAGASRPHGPDLIDAAKDGHEPSALDTAGDRAAVQPGGHKLGGRHDPVLTRRERQRGAIRGVHFVDITERGTVASTFGTHTVRFVDLSRVARLASTKCTLGHAH